MNKGVWVLALCLFVNVCQADSVIDVVEKKAGAVKIHHFYIAKDKVSFDDAQSAMIFDTKQRQMTVINHTDKSYMLISAEQIRQLAGQVGGMMQQMRSQMEAQMQSMPPEQRAQYQKMMAQMGQAAMPKSQPDVTTKTTGKTQAISGVDCTMVEVYKAGIMESENCVASISAFGIPSRDYQTLKRFLEYQSELAKSMGGDQHGFHNHMLNKNMMPVKIMTYSNGQLVGTSLFLVSDKAPDASVFSVPAAYTQKNTGFSEL